MDGKPPPLACRVPPFEFNHLSLAEVDALRALEQMQGFRPLITAEQRRLNGLRARRPPGSQPLVQPQTPRPAA